MTWSAGLQATTIKLRPREAALSTGDSLLRQASAGEESSPVDFSGFSKSKGELEVAFRRALPLHLMALEPCKLSACLEVVIRIDVIPAQNGPIKLRLRLLLQCCCCNGGRKAGLLVSFS